MSEQQQKRYFGSYQFGSKEKNQTGFGSHEIMFSRGFEAVLAQKFLQELDQLKGFNVVIMNFIEFKDYESYGNQKINEAGND